MKKLTTIISLLLLVFFVSSCKNEKSLQAYLVDSSGKEGFYSGDLPVGSMLTPKTEVSNQVKETIKSIKKVNVAFLKKTTENDVAYEAEKAKLKNIFTNKDYINLGKVKAKGMHMNLYYTGDTENIDEIIAFGYSKEAGVGVARLLGENMNPARIMEMMNDIKVDANNVDLSQFNAIFKGKQNTINHFLKAVISKGITAFSF